MKNIENAPFISTFEQHLDKHYGMRGTPEREQYEEDSKAFRISEMLKEERRLAKLTQEDLAQKTGIKKSLIARLERGKIELSRCLIYFLRQVLVRVLVPKFELF